MSTVPTFIHLRMHSEYSVSDGIVRIDGAVEKAVADNMPALALTDLSNLFGMVKFYEHTRSRGVKPIIGCEVWITNESDRDKPSRLLLLCKSYSGYLLLCRLLSRAYRENQYRGRAEVKKSWLNKNEIGTQGLIALSGAHFSEINMVLMQDDFDQAKTLAQEWSDLFPDHFYIEIQRVGRDNEEIILQNSLALSSALRLPVVATHPVQFLSPEEYKAHEARVCIAEGYVLGDRRRPKKFTKQQYFKTQAEMEALFSDIPVALANSVEIAKRCNQLLELGVNRLPLFPTPNNESLEKYLHDQALDGLENRMKSLFPDQDKRDLRMPQYRTRLDFEVTTIVQMGFAGYFLIVSDFINWAKQNEVPVGPGRGSGAGSLVAFSLGITDLDPLRYDLLFERFLNPERVSMPDFDIDFCQDGRERVIEYVKQKYGAESVSQIVTFGTMAAKAVIRDVGRVLDLPYNFVDKLAKLVPFELGMTLKKAREIEPQLNQRAQEEEVRILLELAEGLEGITRNVGMHAGGVLIASGKITDFCPVYCADSTDSVVSQLDKDDVEKIGLVKFDFLGLRTLTILDWTVRYIRQRVSESGINKDSIISEEIPREVSKPETENNEFISLETLPLEDPATYALLRQGNVVGVFQFESRGMKDLLQKTKPDRFEDIIALVALYRPGPMDLIPEFTERKLGKRVEYLDPRLQPILSPTYGVMIYQEQVMQIAQVIGGYSLGGADLLRRAMGKKKVEEMEQQRDVFVNGAIKNGLTKSKAAELFGLMEKFAGYGFNKSHAAAYALIAFQTAYLKAHYPSEFMAATLSADMDDTDKVHAFFEDSIANYILVLPPDINLSVYRFVPVDGKTIRYGLGAVKGTGESAITVITRERDQAGPYTDLFDFCQRVDKRIVNRRVLESLIRAGTFDSINTHRAGLLSSVGIALESAEQTSRAANQVSLFSGDDIASERPCMVSVPQWEEKERLQNEKMALGFYLSGHPFNIYADELKNFVSTRLDRLSPQRDPQLLAGVIYSIRIQMTKRGKKMGVIVLDDGKARVELVVYSEIFDANRDWLKEDQLLVVEAKVGSKGDNEASSGGLRITTNKLFDLAGARSRYAKSIRLHCNGSSNAAKLRDLLAPYCNNGSSTLNSENNSCYCPVSITYHNQNAACEIELGDEWCVSLHDNLLQSLSEHFQAENVRVIY
jgi:DNA polymerase III subunit alpha